MEYHQLMKAEGLESKGYDIALLCKFDGFILGLENYLLDFLIDLNAIRKQRKADRKSGLLFFEVIG